ncbi:MAG TPA: DJ-1/PfpI family protein [Polyangiaceae bacterium]|jgi:transcriptional regulator GlxA family with amidase domain|nr:DJ-1/PfpI family protein [Polyangiaceae bacterium]
MPESIDIVFALFPRVTQLDFTGPFEVLWRVPGARLTLASRQGGALSTDGGLCVSELTRLADVPRADVLCVPGGTGVTDALRDAEYLQHVRRLGAGARYLTSVCSGSLILAGAGLLEGKRAACHWAWRALLAEQGVRVDEARIVRDGHVLSGGGVTAGIDFGLALAAELAGEDAACAIQLAIEYAPAPPLSSGRPETAPPAILSAARERAEQQYPERRAALLAARGR